MKLLMVINPISGGIDKASFLSEAEKIFHKHGVSCKIFKTTGKEDEINLKREIEIFHPDKIASVGGDGTLRLVGLVLLNSPYSIGIVPMGSANGMAKELGVDEDPLKALEDIILSDMTVGLDIVILNDQYYLLHIGDVGTNAKIIYKYEKDPNRGMVTYVKYFFTEIGKLDPFQMRILANDKEVKKMGIMVAICNARKYGTGIPLNLSGSLTDGQFEIVLIEKVNFNSLIQAGLSKFNERFFSNEAITVITASKAEIYFNEPKLLQLDGEVIGEFEKLDIKIIPAAINLTTKKDQIPI